MVREMTECTYCGGLHFGATEGFCPYQCHICKMDTRPDAIGFGKEKCVCYAGPKPGAVNTVRCMAPNCPHQKAEVNHWWILTVIDVYKRHIGETPNYSDFRCHPYDPNANRATSEYPVCSRECAHKLFERYMETGGIR